jgi:murein DD-endopeptidase MepM/ murein hydrolase activator NlpD
MRTRLAAVAAASAAAAVLVGGTPAGATGGLTVPTPAVSPLPTVSVPVPLPTEPADPLPSPSLPVPVPSVPGGGGDGGSGGSGGTGGTGGSYPGPGTAGGGTVGAGEASEAGRTERARERRARDATPMVAGTAAARDLVDDESSPAMLEASRNFLTADRGIAEIARQKRIMAQLKQAAAEKAATYRAIDLDVLTAQTAAQALHERHESVRGQLAADVRNAYVTGRPTTDEGVVSGLAMAIARLADGSTRADMRVGGLTVSRDAVRAEFEALSTRYDEAKQALADANRRLTRLAAQRSDALQAVRAAGAGDRALHQARIVESGQLGAQIRAASAALDRAGTTVQGTGELARPVAGQVTSPFGMRLHPILRYTKLHTGTDFAGGDPTVRAADDGRVLMTVVSTAYGNFTVVDHGVVDGKRLTTAYAHQARFLVAEGDAVRKGQPIGVVGSTGYSTGPHLHFEVREDGTVVDPARHL